MAVRELSRKQVANPWCLILKDLEVGKSQPQNSKASLLENNSIWCTHLHQCPLHPKWTIPQWLKPTWIWQAVNTTCFTIPLLPMYKHPNSINSMIPSMFLITNTHNKWTDKWEIDMHTNINALIFQMAFSEPQCQLLSV